MLVCWDLAQKGRRPEAVPLSPGSSLERGPQRESWGQLCGGTVCWAKTDGPSPASSVPQIPQAGLALQGWAWVTSDLGCGLQAALWPSQASRPPPPHLLFS